VVRGDFEFRGRRTPGTDPLNGDGRRWVALPGEKQGLVGRGRRHEGRSLRRGNRFLDDIGAVQGAGLKARHSGERGGEKVAAIEGGHVRDSGGGQEEGGAGDRAGTAGMQGVRVPAQFNLGRRACLATGPRFAVAGGETCFSVTFPF
jgi:hypothetical protein